VKASVMCRSDNDQFREIAHRLEEELPGWLVIWGIYTQQFVAFPPADGPRGTILTANYPEALVERARAAERERGRTSGKGGLIADDT
jgi:hypothetical protein